MPLLNELTRNIIALGHETLPKVFHQLMNVAIKKITYMQE